MPSRFAAATNKEISQLIKQADQYFLCTSLKSRYHKSFYFESFKIRNSVDNQLFRDYLGYYLDNFFLANQCFL